MRPAMDWFWIVSGVVEAALDGKWAGKWPSPVIHLNSPIWIAAFAGELVLDAELD